MAPAMSRKNRVWSRREIEGLIADGRKIIILGDQIIKADAWLPYHPALHSKEAQAHMQKYVIGRVHGRWENFLPPVQGGTFRTLGLKHVNDEALYAEEDVSSSGKSTPPSPVFDTEETGDEVRLRRASNDIPISRASSLFSSEPEPGKFRSAEVSTAHAISSKYPRLDKRSQDEVVSKYRQLDEKLQSEGLYECPYGSYAVESVRYLILFVLFLPFLHYTYYALSGLFPGLLWHLLAFTVHEAGNISITHEFHTDSCIGIFITDFLGGLSVGWWKRNHNVHHIATNSPEHDPGIQHMPFFAISSYGRKLTMYMGRI